jgi:hypothetical protein
MGALDTNEMTLQLDERCYLDYANLAVRLPDRYQVQEALLRTAVHSICGIEKDLDYQWTQVLR